MIGTKEQREAESKRYLIMMMVGRVQIAHYLLWMWEQDKHTAMKDHIILEARSLQRQQGEFTPYFSDNVFISAMEEIINIKRMKDAASGKIT